MIDLFAEIPVQQTLEGFAVSGFVAGHFMHGVVDRVKAERLRLFGEFGLAKRCAVFCGHVHTWDERNFNGVHYLTLEAMSERNSPEPGNYLVRMHVGEDELAWTPVKMNYTPKNKKK